MKKYCKFLFLLIILTTFACTQEKPEDEPQSAETQEQTAENNTQEASENEEAQSAKSDIDEYANKSLQSMFDFLANTQKIKGNFGSARTLLTVTRGAARQVG